MPYFDRFDICDAYARLECDYNVNGILRDRPTCRRKRESVGVQLYRMGYRPGPLTLDNLTENAQAIYDAAVERLNLPKG